MADNVSSDTPAVRTPRIVIVDRLEVDLEARTAKVGEIKLRLRPKERDMLMILAAHKGHVLSRDDLLNVMYAGEEEPEPKVLDVFVHHLRARIAALNNGENYITTVYGKGYMLEDPAIARRQGRL